MLLPQSCCRRWHRLQGCSVLAYERWDRAKRVLAGYEAS
jgi:hypothetical protein